MIFGSGHPLGMDKFLEVAWDQNKVSGDANFDVHREGIAPEEPFLLAEMNVPTKIKLFERELERAILAGACRDELAIIEVCYRHGVLRKHASPIIGKLIKEKRIKCDFQVPSIKREHLQSPRKITLLGTG